MKKESVLIIDIGNSSIAVALMHGLSIVKTWKLETRKNDESYYHTEIPNSLSGKKDITAIVISSVVPELNDVFEEISLTHFGCAPIILSPEMDLGIKIWYEKLSQIGVDRLANAYGAVKLYSAPAIIIDFGTAITFDIVNQAGDYLGGVIAPGMGVARDALYRQASLLPWVNITKPEVVLGQDTIGAMESGLYWGFLGLIKELLTKIKEEVFSNNDVLTIATGGYITYFIRDLPEINKFDAHLTLKGVKLLYDYVTRNKSSF
ncbi:type III pantothenate kinase [Chlamydiota bacterium]